MPNKNDDVAPQAASKSLLYPAERRRAPRYETDSVVIIHTLNPSSTESFTGKIVNVSANGLALRLSKGLLPGVEVEIVSGRLVIIGRIRFSRVSDAGFDHGIAIDQLITLNMEDSASQILKLASQTAAHGQTSPQLSHQEKEYAGR